jgi:hypothetical protein
MAEFVPSVRRERHHWDDSRTEARKGEHHKLPPVGQLDDDPIIGLKTELSQSDGSCV